MRNSSKPRKRRRQEALDFMPGAVTINYLLKSGWVVKAKMHRLLLSGWRVSLKENPRARTAERAPAHHKPTDNKE